MLVGGYDINTYFLKYLLVVVHHPATQVSGDAIVFSLVTVR